MSHTCCADENGRRSGPIPTSSTRARSAFTRSKESFGEGWASSSRVTDQFKSSLGSKAYRNVAARTDPRAETLSDRRSHASRPTRTPNKGERLTSGITPSTPSNRCPSAVAKPTGRLRRRAPRVNDDHPIELSGEDRPVNSRSAEHRPVDCDHQQAGG